MSSQIHVGDIGTQLIVAVFDDNEIVDISEALSLNIILQKPDGEKNTKSATLYTDGTDGKMVYISTLGDFDEAGNFKIQGKVTLTGGVYYTSVGTFKVHCNL
jgi:hypothetical protein